ncbi:endospore germination permease [Paenibacillus ginsengarvi]|uniref:endospore germination permease n=1 Tax=Paenibacillus ginsengarvi TaxID=400777 RepID=UPI0019606830|nr:endospore germination permease [Paenibacillus ginsengarvi]
MIQYLGGSKMESAFSRPQIVFMLLLSLGISNHVFIIPHLIQAAGRDAWISILLGYAVLIGWSFILIRVLKSMGTSLFSDWLHARIGLWGGWMFRVLLLLYILVLAVMIVFDTTRNIDIYLLPKTPNTVVVVSFVLISYWAASAGLKTIVYMSAVLLPIVWLLGIGISIFTMGSKDYGIMFPIWAEGLRPNLNGSVIVVGGSVELLLLLLIQHNMRRPVDYKTLFVLLTLLVGLIAGPTFGSLSAFGPAEAGNMRIPAFEQWRLLMLGDYISHVDFLAAFQLMSGSVTRTALLVHLLPQLLTGRSGKFRQTIMVVGAAIASIPSLLQVSDITMQGAIHNYFYLSSFLFGIVLITGLFAITCIKRKKGA